MPKFLLAIWCIFCSVQSHAQSSVSGKVSELNTTKPLAFVNIIIESGGKKSIIISDSAGNFSIPKLQNKGYNLLFQLIGYQDFALTIFPTKDTMLNILLQPDNNQLKDVAVQSRKPPVEWKTDRLVLNVAGNIVTEGKRTTDVLKYAPGVFITNNTLSMAGKTSVIVYLNDFQVRMDSKLLPEYLNSLSPNDIQSIEIITNPPAQYDAEGNVGIIKIVMKKNIHPGWKGFAEADFMQNTYSTIYGNTGIDYVGKKIAVALNLYGENYSFLNRNEYWDYFPAETLHTINPKKATWKNLAGSININYQVSKNSSINLVYQSTVFENDASKDLANTTDYINNANNAIDSALVNNGSSTYHANQQNADLFFKQQLKKEGSYFDVEFSWLNHYNTSNRPFSSMMLVNGNSENLGAYQSASANNSNIYTAQTDFVFPFKNWNLNYGGKLSFTNNTADYNFYENTDGTYLLNEAASNTFDYTENTQALYATASMNVKK